MFKRVHTPEDLRQVFMIRAIVFMEEQSIPYALEMDEHDSAAVHILGVEDGEPVACGRIRYTRDEAFFQRLAVRRAWRGKGFGNRLLDFMLEDSRKNGFRRFSLHAQIQAQGFYARNGFTLCGEKFMEAGIPHVCMRLVDPA
jgi:predicted GNAT family N-acyltransferase